MPYPYDSGGDFNVPIGAPDSGGTSLEDIQAGNYGPGDTPGGGVPDPKQYELSKNPQLPATPLGAYTDSQYLAQLAALRFEISQRYNDIRRKIGYTDDKGNFIPGLIQTQAARQRADLNRSLGLAREGVTNQMRNAGTLFSGYRGTAQARAEFPFSQALADLELQEPQQLSDLYEQAGNLSQEFAIRQAGLIADAAGRNYQKGLGGGLTPTGGPGSPFTPYPPGVGVPTPYATGLGTSTTPNPTYGEPPTRPGYPPPPYAFKPLP